jgi:hypothetical protein
MKHIYARRNIQQGEIIESAYIENNPDPFLFDNESHTKLRCLSYAKLSNNPSAKYIRINKHEIGVVALRDINKDDTILFSYGNYWNNRR